MSASNLGYQWGKVTNWGGDRAERHRWAAARSATTGSSASWVLGLEADIQGSGANDTFAAYKFSNPWFGTVRGRAGYAMNNVLLYVTGGLAYGGGRVDFGGISESQTHLGWTIGGGVEVGLTPNWSAKAEYLYVRLEDRGYVLTGVNNGFSVERLPARRELSVLSRTHDIEHEKAPARRGFLFWRYGVGQFSLAARIERSEIRAATPC